VPKYTSMSPLLDDDRPACPEAVTERIARLATSNAEKVLVR